MSYYECVDCRFSSDISFCKLEALLVKLGNLIAALKAVVVILGLNLLLIPRMKHSMPEAFMES